MKNLNLLHQLESLERSRLLLNLADDELFKALQELAINFNKGNIKLNKTQQKHISRFKGILKRLTKKPRSKSIKRKLIKQSGGFLPYLLPALASIAASFLTK